jgi:hypothetical protein
MGAYNYEGNVPVEEKMQVGECLGESLVALRTSSSFIETDVQLRCNAG